MTFINVKASSSGIITVDIPPMTGLAKIFGCIAGYILYDNGSPWSSDQLPVLTVYRGDTYNTYVTICADMFKLSQLTFMAGSYTINFYREFTITFPVYGSKLRFKPDVYGTGNSGWLMNCFIEVV